MFIRLFYLYLIIKGLVLNSLFVGVEFFFYMWLSEMKVDYYIYEFISFIGCVNFILWIYIWLFNEIVVYVV